MRSSVGEGVHGVAAAAVEGEVGRTAGVGVVGSAGVGGVGRFTGINGAGE